MKDKLEAIDFIRSGPNRETIRIVRDFIENYLSKLEDSRAMDFRIVSATEEPNTFFIALYWSLGGVHHDPRFEKLYFSVKGEKVYLVDMMEENNRLEEDNEIKAEGIERAKEVFPRVLDEFYNKRRTIFIEGKKGKILSPEMKETAKNLLDTLEDEKLTRKDKQTCLDSLLSGTNSYFTWKRIKDGVTKGQAHINILKQEIDDNREE